MSAVRPLLDPAVREAVLARGVTRVCHFSLARTLPHILKDPQGIRSRADLDAQGRDVLYATDHQRLDGYRSHIDCSIEHPNSWMLERVRDREPHFKDMVVLLIDPQVLWWQGTLFAPRNAAAGGVVVQGGRAGFEALYAPVVRGAGGRVFRRAARRVPACPTDGQAEVLVPSAIPASLIRGIAVHSEVQAAEEAGRLAIAGVTSVPPWIVTPALFCRDWVDFVDAGRHPPEVEWSSQ